MATAIKSTTEQYYSVGQAVILNGDNLMFHRRKGGSWKKYTSTDLMSEGERFSRRKFAAFVLKVTDKNIHLSVIGANGKPKKIMLSIDNENVIKHYSLNDMGEYNEMEAVKKEFSDMLNFVFNYIEEEYKGDKHLCLRMDWTAQSLNFIMQNFLNYGYATK